MGTSKVYNMADYMGKEFDADVSIHRSVKAMLNILLDMALTKVRTEHEELQWDLYDAAKAFVKAWERREKIRKGDTCNS